MHERMLGRLADLSLEALDLEPYDLAVLACVLGRAEDLLGVGERDLAFSEIDSDLQPWDRNGDRKDKLADLYDGASVWVYGDYLLQNPPMPPGWHNRNR